MPKVFGILNLTPDSFSDGDESVLDPAVAMKKAKALIQAGADVIDIGAESTRPGATELSTSDEWARLKPFLDNYNLDTPLSLDSRNPDIVKRALYQTDAIRYINDVSGMTNPEMLMILEQHADADLKFISMHSKGGIPGLAAEAITEEFYSEDGGLYEHMKVFWNAVLEAAQKHKLKKENFILDPGLGFGKNLKHSLEIPSLIPRLKQEFGLPVMIGASRKRFLKEWKNKPDASLEDLDTWTSEYNYLFDLDEKDFLRMHLVSARVQAC